MRRPSLSRMLPTFVFLAVSGGLAVAAHYVFNVSFTWDDEPAVNEAHVQNRAGQLNVAKKVGDTVTAYFSGNPTPYGHFVRRFLVSSNAFEQTGGPFYVGGGTCSISDPSTTIMSPEGQVTDLGNGLASALTLRGIAEDGTPFVRDQFAIVQVDPSGIEVTKSTFGFAGIKNEQAVVLEQPNSREGEAPPGDSIDASGWAIAGDSFGPNARRQFLLIQHQGSHPPNHRYAPTPHVTFVKQRYRPSAGTSRQGWAVVAFGSQGDIQAIRLLPADGRETDRTLTARVRAGVRGDFQDDRRHPFTAYFTYSVSDGVVTMPEPPFVSLPMCCSCDPNPYDDYDVQCP